VRDPDRSVFLARKAVEWEPHQAEHWSTLGLAYYRVGDPRAALEAVLRANRLRHSEDIADAFLLAMIYCRLGDNDEAHRWKSIS